MSNLSKCELYLVGRLSLEPEAVKTSFLSCFSDLKIVAGKELDYLDSALLDVGISYALDKSPPKLKSLGANFLKFQLTRLCIYRKAVSVQ